MTSDYWERESGFYDRQWKGSPVSEFDYACTKDMLFRFLEPSMNDKILEIGCGLGTWTELVGSKCRAITAVDVSKEMIRKAKKNVSLKNVKFVVSDFLSFGTKERFNKIFAVRSFEYLDDTKAGLRKVWGMLKPSGRFVIITKSKPCAWEFVYHERWKRSGFRQNKISYTKMRKLLHSVGFVDVKMLPAIIRFPIFRGGNREIPMIPNSVAKYLLAPGFVLRRFQPLIVFAESYAAYATRGES
ncbi:MAG: class I SAM-dependent methyltransferase [Candidatus Aenigmarchaeota archaeon]|nr:class I SAM-dependent methyltransferase [Candidatus Aenigmarchaeota archaeon]